MIYFKDVYTIKKYLVVTLMYIQVLLLSLQHPKDILQNIHSHTLVAQTARPLMQNTYVDTFNYTDIKHLHAR